MLKGAAACNSSWRYMGYKWPNSVSSDSIYFSLIRHTSNCRPSLICKRCLRSSSISNFQCNNGSQSDLLRHYKKTSFHAFNGTMNNLRHSSSAVTVASAVAEVSASNQDLAGAASLVFDETPSVVDAVSNVVTLAEPTLRSLGLGSASWWPSGLLQSALESIHVGLNVPWWAAIAIGTVCIRFAMFPLVILAQRNAIELQNNLPTMQRLQERMISARRTGDHVEALKASEELMGFMQRNKINPLKNMMVPIAQFPFKELTHWWMRTGPAHAGAQHVSSGSVVVHYVALCALSKAVTLFTDLNCVFLSMYRGLNGMAELPVASMQTGGLLWFTDLTIQDPFYGLPLMTAATLLVTVEVGVDGIKANQMGSQQLKYFMRAMPIIIFPFIIHFPSAMLCYWFTSNAFSLVQVLFLKIPAVREFFKIPVAIIHSSAAPLKPYDIPKKGFVEGFRESFDNMSLVSQMQERKELDALKLKEPKKTASEDKATKSSK